MTRKLLTVLAVSSLLLVVVAAGVAVAQDVRNADRRLADLQEELHGLVQRLARASEEIEILDDQVLRAEVLVARGEPLMLAAMQQESARNAITAYGGQLISVESLATELGGGYQKSALVVHARLSETGLFAFLGAQEAAAPETAVEMLQVQQLDNGPGGQLLDVSVMLVAIIAHAPAL